MYIANKKQVDLIDGKLIAEASTLGLKPGDWPDMIAVLDDNQSGYLFSKGRALTEADEFLGFVYQDPVEGVTLEVLND